MEYIDLSHLTYFDKIHLLWQYDSNFGGILIGVGLGLVLEFIVLYIWGMNFLYTIFPGGQVYGNPTITSFPRWLAIVPLILGTILYLDYKVKYTIFINKGFNPDGSFNMACEPKYSTFAIFLDKAFGISIDQFFICSILIITVFILVIYVLWFRD